jgi:hypothetical protein
MPAARHFSRSPASAFAVSKPRYRKSRHPCQLRRHPQPDLKVGQAGRSPKPEMAHHLVHDQYRAECVGEALLEELTNCCQDLRERRVLHRQLQYLLE